jgi:hypothetical protein
MHAHERTLLARLGFADPDRRDPLHDIACRYLATPDVSMRIAKLLNLEYSNRPQCFRTEAGYEMKCESGRFVKEVRTACEYEIDKGVGQYRTTVGFIDVFLRIELEEAYTNVQKRRHYYQSRPADTTWEPSKDFVERDSEIAAIEVKSSDVPVSDVIRQINLYRSYSNIRRWILATTYQLNQSQFDCLANARILHIHLGQRFQDFVKEQANTPCSNSVEV